MALKILILGAGAIGTMLGVHLCRAHEEVTFLDHPQVVERLEKEGIALVLGGKEHRIRRVKAITGAVLREAPLCYDLVITAVKAYHVAEVCRLIDRSHFKSLLTIQNGVGNEEFLAGHFGPQKVFSGAITLPVARRPSGEVEITNMKGGLGLASVNGGESCAPLAELFRRAGFHLRVFDNYRELKWSKLLLNMVGNALSAILDMPPSGIFNDRRLTKLEKRAFVEGLEVMKALGLNPVDLPGYPVSLIAKLFRYSPPTILELVMTCGGSASRGSKMPSLHIDLASGSPHSEVEVLNGAIARQALKLDVMAPVNILFYEVLEGMTAGEISRDQFRGNPEKLIKMLK